MRHGLLLVPLLGLVNCAAGRPELADRTRALAADFAARTPPPIADTTQAPGAEAGQYVVFREVSEGGGEALIRFAIDAAAADGVVLSIERLDAHRVGRLRLTFARWPDRQEASAALLRAATRSGTDEVAHTVTFDAADPAGRSAWLTANAPLLAWLFPTPTDAAPFERVTPAGRFQDCRSAGAQQADGPIDSAVHSAVPLGGLVEGRARGGHHRLELVEFGFDGRGSIL